MFTALVVVLIRLRSPFGGLNPDVRLIRLPGVPALWLISVVIALAAYLLCRYKPWSAIGVVPLAIAYHCSMLLVLHTSFRPNALPASLFGATYEAHVIVSLSLIVLAMAIGLLRAPPQGWRPTFRA